MNIVIITTRATQPSIVARIRAAWSKAMTWTPTDRQLRRIGAAIECSGRMADVALKAFAILAAIYFSIEIGMAFLPGGAVSRVLGGLR
ncbi:MAG: hypothetical protein P4K93_07525 [Terracidiphilus sp.]|nr:hypothetical protein [Terracidiphilus sp.]